LHQREIDSFELLLIRHDENRSKQIKKSRRQLKEKAE